MEIIIEYDSKWSAKFTDAEGKTIVNSMQDLSIDYNKTKITNSSCKINSKDNLEQKLNKLNSFSPNYQYNTINKNTVIGILSRLIGDIRRLDEIKINPENNFLIDIEEKISFKNKIQSYQNEISFLNTKIKKLQDNGAGIINSQIDLMKKNKFTELLYSPFTLNGDINSICNFINTLDNNLEPNTKYLDLMNIDIFVIGFNKWQDITKALIKYENNYKILVNLFKMKFNKKGEQKITNLLGLMILEVLKYMDRNCLFTDERKNSLSVNGNFAGISTVTGGLTIREIYTTLASPKLSASVPFSIELSPAVFDNKENILNKSPKIGVIKETGELIIYLDFNVEEEKFFKIYLDAANVGPFQVGKKGLGFIKKINYKYME